MTGMMEFGVIGGTVIGTVLYVFFWDTSLRHKIVCGVLCLIATIISLTVHGNFVAWGAFMTQIGLCLYYAFWYKIENL